MTAARGRDKALDILRVIAIIFVVTIHTCWDGYSQPFLGFDWSSTAVIGCLARPAVPLFLMCSGALMLSPERKMTIKQLYTKSLPRIIIAMLFWAYVYKLYHLAVGGLLSPSALLQAAKEVLLFNQEFHLYYLHILILVYVFLPITRVLIARASEMEMRYFLLVWFAVGIVYPFIKSLWPFSLITGTPTQWAMNMSYSAIGYGVLGWYIKQHKSFDKRISVLAIILSIAVIITGTFIKSASAGELSERFWNGMTPFVCLYSAGIFALVCACIHEGETSGRVLTFLSKGSFCIYLTHLFFLYGVRHFAPLFGVVPCIVLIPIIVLVLCACALCLYAVLSRIPIVKRYLV
jgi:surface polysaccharide O-acyltransferase-like enzyme